LSSSQSRITAAVAQVEARLTVARRYLPQDLPVCHYARLTGWRPADPALTGWCPGKSKTGSPVPAALRREREVSRRRAEAELLREGLTELMLTMGDKDRLSARAVGCLPRTERDRFAEVIGIPELAPGVLLRGAGDLLAAIEALSNVVCPATALAYGMFVISGMRAREQLLVQAEKIDRLMERVLAGPAVIQALDRAVRFADQPEQQSAQGDAAFQAQFGVLVAVRDRLWELKPGRVATPFLLPQVLDAYLGPEREVGNSLGLAVIDAVVAGKLGFPVRFHVENEVCHLELMVQNKSVYWETVRHSPLSFVPVGSSRRLESSDVYGLVQSSIAATYFFRGRLDQAIDHYRRAIELSPDSGPNHNSLAACYLRKQMPEEAARTAQAALARAIESPEVYHTLGNAYALMQRWPKAIDAFRKAITLKPDYVEAYNNLAFAYYRAGETQQALAAFETALALRPSYTEGHFNLATVCLELANYDRSVAHFKEALRLHPNMTQAHYNMGQALYKQGELDAAISSYRKTIQLDPNHYGAWHNLGIALRDKGQTERAVEALEKAVSINPNLMR